MNMVLTSLTDPRCAEICAAKNKLAESKKSIYANMLKSKDSSCLITCYLTDKGISGTEQESAINTSSSNIILTKSTGSQNTNKYYSTNINSQTTSNPSLQKSQVNTDSVKISPLGVLKQVTLNTSSTNQNSAPINVSLTNLLPNSSNVSHLNSYLGPSTTNIPLPTVNSAQYESKKKTIYDSFNNENVGKLISDITEKGDSNKTYLITTGHMIPNTEAQNTNISSTQLQINQQEMINEMIRNHHENTIKKINIPKQNPIKETLQSGVKEASFVLNNKVKLYRDLNKLDLLIKEEETHPVSLYNEANKLKREEIEENTNKLINEANRLSGGAETSLSHTEELMESSSSEDYEYLNSENEESRSIERPHRHKRKHRHKERRQNNENGLSLNKKEKELKNEVLKNTSIKKQLADSDLIIAEPTKSEYKNINPKNIMVGITPLGNGHVLTSENTTTETLANEMEYEHLNANNQQRMTHDAPSSSLFGPQIEFLGGLQNKNMNGEFSESSINNSQFGQNITEASQNIDNSNNFLASENHKKLIDLENQIIDLQNIHKETVENINKREIINHLNSIDRRTAEEVLIGQHQRIEEQLINEAFLRKQEEINRRIEEERRIRETMEQERRIHETMEEERRIHERETGVPFIEESPEMAVEREINRAEQERDIREQQMEEENRIQEMTDPLNYPPIVNSLNETTEIPPPVIQTKQEEVIQTPTETVTSQIETVETAPHGILEVPPIIPTPPVNSNNMIYSAIKSKMTSSSYNNHVYTTGLTDVII